MSEVILEFTLNDAEGQEFNVNNVSFYIQDSIYKVNNRALLTFKDGYGLLQDSLILSPGSKLGIRYGVGSTVLETKFKINKESMKEPIQSNTIGGIEELELVNAWDASCHRYNKAHNGRISNIIKRLAQENNFYTISINDTGNDDIWYQLNMTNTEFINKILLPNSYSQNADNTPFFCFISNDGKFNYRNFDSFNIEDPGVVTTLTLSSKNTTEKGDILNIRKISPSYTDISSSLKVNSYTSSSDGSLNKESMNIIKYPTTLQSGKMPILNTQSDLVTDTRFFYSQSTSTTDDENTKGQKIYSLRNSFFTQRWVVLTPFDPSLVAGKVVQLNLYVPADSGDLVLSNTMGGKYLVESSEHIWDAENSLMLTKLVVGRKNVPIKSTAKFYKQTFGA